MTEHDWKNLSDTQKNALVKQMLVGMPKTAENTNRAKDALACNSFLVEKYMKELQSEEGYAKYDEDRANSRGSETREDESGYNMGQMKDVEAELG